MISFAQWLEYQELLADAENARQVEETTRQHEPGRREGRHRHGAEGGAGGVQGPGQNKTKEQQTQLIQGGN